MLVIFNIIRVSIASFVLFTIFKLFHVVIVSIVLYTRFEQKSFFDLLNERNIDPLFSFIYFLPCLAFFTFALFKLLKNKTHDAIKTTFFSGIFSSTQVTKNNSMVLDTVISSFEIIFIITALSYGAGYIYGLLTCNSF